jgi:hypothetical protein
MRIKIDWNFMINAIILVLFLYGIAFILDIKLQDLLALEYVKVKK